MNATDIIIEKGLEGLNRFYSIYRAVVIDNQDPDKANNLKVWIPEVLGGLQAWAIPRNQQGGEGNGFKSLTPDIGDYVYVTFEYGDASKPLWEYHGWAKGESPFPLNDPNYFGFITPKGNRIIVNEEDGTLDVSFKGQIFVRSASEVIISGGTLVNINGEDGVVVNGGENGGVINIDPLTQKLNQLVQEIETIKAQINTHTHTGNSGTPTSPPITPISQTISQFSAEDYEDTKHLH